MIPSCHIILVYSICRYDHVHILSARTISWLAVVIRNWARTGHSGFVARVKKDLRISQQICMVTRCVFSALVDSGLGYGLVLICGISMRLAGDGISHWSISDGVTDS